MQMHSQPPAKTEQLKGPVYMTLVQMSNTFGIGPLAGEESAILFF